VRAASADSSCVGVWSPPVTGAIEGTCPALAAPAGLTAASGCPVRLDWSPVEGATHYVVKGRTRQSDWARLGLPCEDAFEDAKAHGGTTWQYKVAAARSGCPTGPWSAIRGGECDDSLAARDALRLEMSRRGAAVELRWLVRRGRSPSSGTRTRSSSPSPRSWRGWAADTFRDGSAGAGSLLFYVVQPDEE